MKSSRNSVQLIGRLGKDPEVRHLEGGVTVASFPLATSETFTKDGRKIEQTEWHNIVLWRGLAELSQKYLHKSSLVYIEGRLKTRHWEDRDHHKKVATEIIADNLIMLDKRSEAQSGEEHPDTFHDNDIIETP